MDIQWYNVKTFRFVLKWDLCIFATSYNVARFELLTFYSAIKKTRHEFVCYLLVQWYLVQVAAVSMLKSGYSMLSVTEVLVSV